MPANPPENMPRITAYLLYEDVDSALDWLAKTFGFRERMRLAGPDGKTNHAEMPYVYVDDVDKHFEHAKEAGATIFEEPQDQFYGDRRYDPGPD